jgi:hypothetical protein
LLLFLLKIHKLPLFFFGPLYLHLSLSRQLALGLPLPLPLQLRLMSPLLSAADKSWDQQLN